MAAMERDDHGDGVSIDEVGLAARNHGMPLEALRYDVTPPGLHYLLIHYDIPAADPASWRLEIAGNVERPRSLSLDELHAMPRVTQAVTLECAGNGRALLSPRAVSQPWLLEAVGNAEWTGTPLRDLLAAAGLPDGAEQVVFTGADRGVEGDLEQDYERALPVTEATRHDVIVAYEMNGQPLLPQHGFPLRLIVPGWYGMTHVKWLRRIDVRTEPFEGYQHTRSYRWQDHEDDPGVPLERIRVRSLMAPPGIPHFLPRTRRVRAGTVELEGRAWSGHGSITRVELSADAGSTWRDARLGPEPRRHAWRRWTAEWEAFPGEHILCCRATDASGSTQPLEADWNVGGYANNAVQRVTVTVVP
jgi:sulfane dehydrogenase subunit SoxC